MTTHREHLPTTEQRVISPERLGAISWGLFFVWMGIAIAAKLGFGIGLVGVGVITVGAQLARWALRMPIEGFWLVVGLLFVAAGVWPLLNMGISFAPLVLLAIGVLIAAGGLSRKRAGQ